MGFCCILRAAFLLGACLALPAFGGLAQAQDWPTKPVTLAYNFEQDFDPITIVATVPNILIVNPQVPAKNVAELIAYLKANPGKVSYGSAGVGSTEHMSAELFRALSGTDIIHVPYRGGAPMLADLIAGNIQMSIETSGAATPLVKAGSVRALVAGQALGAVSRSADARGVGPERLRRLDLVRLPGAQRHAGADPHQTLQHHRRNPEVARHHQEARRLRRRARWHAAGAICRLHSRRDRQVGRPRQEGRHHDGIASLRLDKRVAFASNWKARGGKAVQVTRRRFLTAGTVAVSAGLRNAYAQNYCPAFRPAASTTLMPA
jgi:hypothetical protein